MVKKRENWRVNIPEPYKNRIKNNQCPNCTLPYEKWKRIRGICCSVECSREYFNKKVIYNWNQIRIKAFERNNYTCVKCKKQYPDYDLIGDHIKPIALGGEEFDINNVQTLCKPCNITKTKEDIKEIAKLRIIEKNQKGNRLLKYE